MKTNTSHINGWSKKRVGEIATRVISRAGVGSTPYIEIGDVDAERKQYSIKDKPSPGICISAENNDVIISKVRPTRGAIAQLQQQAFVSPAFSVLRASPEDADFLFYTLSRQDFFSYLGNLETGTTYPSCDDGDIENYEIDFPNNATERQKVAQIISQIDNTIEKTDALIKKYEGVRTGMMQDLFRYGVDENRNLRTTPPKWQMMPIGKLAEVSNGTTPSMARSDYWNKGTVPWLSSGKINEYIISTPSELVTERALKETSLRLFPKDTILVAMVGQGKTRGMSARLAFSSTINQNLAGIIPSSQLDAKFLHYYLDHHYSELRAVGRGSNQDALTCSLIQEYIIPVPPIEEQRRISARLFQVEELVKKEIDFRNKLSRLKNGLMQDLLTGTVRTIEK
jgi:type I restriction enzyme S subunit